MQDDTRAVQFVARAWTTKGIARWRVPASRKTMPPAVSTVTSRKHEETPTPADEEWQVIQQALAGDSEALSMLFARYSLQLYRAAFSVLRSKEDAEDALQEGLLSAYLKLESFEGRSRFSTWLTRIVLNAAFMKRRRLKAHLQVSLEDIAGEDAKPPAAQAIDARPNAEQVFAQGEAREAVGKAMDRLSPLLRSALRLRDIQGFSTREAAKAEDVNISLIKSRTLRARRKIASLLEARGVNL
jgi:RNA polymerase sigma-70 factor (ECF subfamily)